MNTMELFAGTRHERRRNILRELGLPILFGAAVLLFSATMLLGVNISALQGGVAWLQHNQQILESISEAEAGVVGEQLTVRSYALTGNPRFLQYQDIERRKTLGAMGRIAALAASDDNDAARVRKLGAMVGQEMALWQSLRGTGPDHAQRLAKAIDDDKLRLMVLGTRKALAYYRLEKVRAIGARQEMLMRQLSRAFFLSIGIIVAAFLLGVAGVAAGQFRIPLWRH